MVRGAPLCFPDDDPDHVPGRVEPYPDEVGTEATEYLALAGWIVAKVPQIALHIGMEAEKEDRDRPLMLADEFLCIGLGYQAGDYFAK
ncbi:hypothetical protein GCM10020258_54860 [Sphingomonas yabuuchiae]